MLQGSVIAFLVWVSAAEAKPSAARAVTHEALRAQCLVWAADPKNPWALAHGMTAFGPSYLAADGRRADDVLIGDFLLRNPAVDGGETTDSPYGFAKYATDGTPIEPHTNLILKTLVQARVPLTKRYSTRWGGTVTLAQLLSSLERGYRHVPTRADYWHDSAWTLDVLSATLKPGDAIATGAGPLSISAVMDDALTQLEADDADLQAGLAKGARSVEKRKQGIYAHPCGGLHFVQAVLSWARHPLVRKTWGERVDRQVAILFYRVSSEAPQYERALAQMPQYELQLLTQQVKFYGHFLETTARLKTDLGFVPNDGQLVVINTAKAYLDAATRKLTELKAFETMPELKVSKPQVYLDLIGDSCHASHGLDGWP